MCTIRPREVPGRRSWWLVDGYVDLDRRGGRGSVRTSSRRGWLPVVIGVAKTAFRSATHAIAVLRGDSVRPLYVTAAGMDREAAAALVQRMAGTARIPEALRRVDRLARSAGEHEGQRVAE